MAYDSVRQRIVLFGGSGSSGFLQDTWEWNGTTWTTVALVNVPAARAEHALAYDPQRGVTVLFGGMTDPFTFMSDLWEWNGVLWQQRTPTGGPGARTDAPRSSRSRRTEQRGAANSTPAMLATMRANNHALVAEVEALAGDAGADANRIARWNGTAWSALGTGMNGAVDALTKLANGDLVAAGSFTTAGGVSANRSARCSGTSWSALATGMDSDVFTLATLPGGDLVAGGNFLTANGLASAYLARLSTTCPAIVTPWGTGCPSSGGANTLVANTLPWVDATFRATATGLPATAIVLELTSFTPIPQGIAPLTIVFPQAGPGCDILTLPDFLLPVVTTTGTVQSSLFLPNIPQLVGLSFHHQMVPIEFDPQGAWVAVTATNALQLTVGAF